MAVVTQMTQPQDWHQFEIVPIGNASDVAGLVFLVILAFCWWLRGGHRDS